MDPDQAKAYFRSEPVLEHYTEAATRLGLWKSEELIIRRVFRPDQTLLDLGTGAGRIAFGLYELGYHKVLGVDFSKELIREARRFAKLLDYPIPFRVMDVTQLELGEEVFDGAIFGFNGLMLIPRHERRLAALRQIHRVLRPGSWLVFTTPDRTLDRNRVEWEAAAQRWNTGQRDPEIEEFGDRVVQSPMGLHFVHLPTPDEVRADLLATGFRPEADVLRSHLANESAAVREFSDDTRFWIAERI